MTHTQTLREEITESIPKPEKLRRHMLLGLLIDADITEDQAYAVFPCESARTAAIKLSKILFGASVELSERLVAGRTSYLLTLTSQKLVNAFRERIISLSGLECSQEEIGYLLRGAFLTAGRINEPMAQAQMEFALSDEERAKGLASFMENNSLPAPGCSKRRNKFIVYYKSNEKICDTLSAMNVGGVLFEYINVSIYKDIENSERRATNCISGNINRAVVAGSRQREACEYLISLADEGLIESGLRTTALLRIDNPTATLIELAELHVPPLTKSGINHRLRKLAAVADAIRESRGM